MNVTEQARVGKDQVGNGVETFLEALHVTSRRVIDRKSPSLRAAEHGS